MVLNAFRILGRVPRSTAAAKSGPAYQIGSSEIKEFTPIFGMLLLFCKSPYKERIGRTLRVGFISAKKLRSAHVRALRREVSADLALL